MRCPGYYKYYLRIYSNEFALIKWGPHAISHIHGHSGADCKFLMLRGSMDEKIFRKNGDIRLRVHEPLGIAHISDKIGRHQMINKEDKPKYSLHYYYW